MPLGVFTASEIDLVLRNSGSSGARVIKTSSNDTHKTVTCSVIIHSVPRLNDTFRRKILATQEKDSHLRMSNLQVLRARRPFNQTMAQVNKLNEQHMASRSSRESCNGPPSRRSRVTQSRRDTCATTPRRRLTRRSPWS